MIAKRLETICHYLNEDDFVLDIGCDHAYLPIYLMKNKLVKHVYATEVNKGPYDNALQNILKNDLKNEISLFLQSGLQNIPLDYNTITIAGMGSNLIVDILSYSDLKNVSKLVIQSNTNFEIIRKYLKDFKIIDETFVKENNVIYEIVVFIKENRPKYNSKELYFGPCNLQKKEKLFYEKYHEILQKKEQQFSKIPVSHPNKENFGKLLEDLKKVLEK